MDKVRAFREALNAGDVERTLSFFTENAVFQFLNEPGPPMTSCGPPSRGKNELRKGFEAMLGIHWEFEDFRVDRSMVTCRGTERAAVSWGVDVLIFDSFQFRFRDGLIESFIGKISAESSRIGLHTPSGAFMDWASNNKARVQFVLGDGVIREVRAKLSAHETNAWTRQFAAFLEWASRNRAGELAEFKTGERYDITKKNAAKWLKLLRQGAKPWLCQVKARRIPDLPLPPRRRPASSPRRSSGTPRRFTRSSSAAGRWTARPWMTCWLK